MKIDNATLDRIAELARLDVSDPAERERLLTDMQRVLDFVVSSMRWIPRAWNH